MNSEVVTFGPTGTVQTDDFSSDQLNFPPGPIVTVRSTDCLEEAKTPYDSSAKKGAQHRHPSEPEEPRPAGRGFGRQA